MCGNDSNDQTVFGDLDLLNEHPFRQGKQWDPFHHDLTLAMKQSFRGFSWKRLYRYMPICHSI
jgi:hypothetical protein